MGQNEDAKADFYNWCGSILMGKETEEAEGERIAKAMIDTGQQEFMIEELGKIQSSLIK